MKYYFLFSNIMMTGLIALCVYGLYWAYVNEDKIMWGAVFALVFSIRKVIKDNLKVGYSRYSVEADKLTGSGEFLYHLQGALSFSLYVGAFIVIVNQALYEPAVLFLISLAILLIIVDIYSYFRNKRNRLFARDF